MWLSGGGRVRNRVRSAMNQRDFFPHAMHKGEVVPQRKVMSIVFGRISVERAAYDVVQQLSSNTQIRRYHTCVMAETPAGTGGMSSTDSSAAFRRLGQYIGVFGTPANEGAISMAMTAPIVTSGRDGRGKKVAMTAPVVNTPGTMAFVLPAVYQRVEAAPRPRDPQVTLRVRAARTCAVITFAGHLTDAAVSKRAAELTAILRHAGILSVHEPAAGGSTEEAAAFPPVEVLRYNPPFTIPMLRTNEILIDLSAQASQLTATPMRASRFRHTRTRGELTEQRTVR